MKYLELNLHILTVHAKRPKKLVDDVVHYQPEELSDSLHFKLRALCVRARTMHGLEMHLMFCNEFWIYPHICSLFKPFCYIEATKSCLLHFLSNLYCTSVKRPTSIKRPLFKVPRVAA